MNSRVLRWIFQFSLLLFCLPAATQGPPALAQQASVTISTGTLESGIMGDTFTIVLPLENTGTGEASSVNVTSASFGAAALTAPTLPIPLGPWAAASLKQIVLQFSTHGLMIGGKYLLSVRGTYESGTAKLSFTFNRLIEVTTPDASTASDLRLWTALDGIRDKAQAVYSLGQPAPGKKMLSFLQSDPEFSDTGISPDSKAVWATLADGSRVAISFDNFALQDSMTATSGLARALRDADPSVDGHLANPMPTSLVATPALTTASTGRAEFPSSPTFRLLNVFPNFSDPILLPALTSWLSLQNYTPVSGATASVEGLKAMNQANDGVFMIRSHGRIIGKGTTSDPMVFELWTTDVANTASKVVNYGDLHSKPARLDFYTAQIQTGVFESHLAITPAFVTEYWKPGTFSSNSFVYIDACQSNVDPNWTAAIKKAGASAYAGWIDDTGDPFAANTTRLVFDRMLGADRYCPETSPGSASKCVVGRATAPIFPQRPFDYSAVTNTEFAMHGLGFSPSKLTALILTPSTPSGNFGLLAPSISNMVMNEGDVVGSSPGDLTINGTFGSEPGSVMVGGEIDNSSGIPEEKGGKEVTIKSWSGSQIVVELPYTGLGSAGNVQVIARNHLSNVAQLTEWRDQSGQFTFTLSGDGSLQELHTYKFHLRADIRKWRKVIHDPPNEPQGPFESANDSSATVSLSGSAPGIGEAFRWSGSQALTNAFTPGARDNLFALNGGVLDSTHLVFAVDDLATHGGTCTIIIRNVPPQISPIETTGPFFWFSLWAHGVPTYTMAELDDTGAIKGGSESGAGVGVACEQSNNGKGGLIWPTIAPQSGTTPDPNSAR